MGSGRISNTMEASAVNCLGSTKTVMAAPPSVQPRKAASTSHFRASTMRSNWVIDMVVSSEDRFADGDDVFALDRIVHLEFQHRHGAGGIAPVDPHATLGAARGHAAGLRQRLHDGHAAFQADGPRPGDLA